MSHPLTATAALRALTWGVLILGTALVLVSSAPYLIPGMDHPFLGERPALAAQLGWRGCLILHIAAGMVCLPGGLLLMSSRALRRWPGLHRSLGRLYGALIIVVMFPTGAYLAWHAKGGLLAGAGFFVSDLAAVVATVKAIEAATRGDLAAHRRGMIRSYAQVASAITFRIFHVAFQLAALPYEAGYVLSLWISVLGNAALAEALIASLGRGPRPAPLPSAHNPRFHHATT